MIDSFFSKCIASLVIVFGGTLGLGTIEAQTEKGLTELAGTMVKDSGFPAVFVAIDRGTENPLIAAAGIRKSGNNTPVTSDDKIHLGSCTKSMTAVLIARLVEQKKLAWTDTIETRMPEVAKKIPESHRQVTLAQLLQHRSGFPADARNWWMRDGATISEFRIAILTDSLNNLPLKPAGKEELYSNLGYMTAGLMAEYAMGSSWEQLIQQYVFHPLDMATAGFGPPSTLGSLEQPWGHLLTEDNRFNALQHDNAPALGPAGTVHMSVRDWCKYCQIFCGNGPKGYLSDDSIKKLVTPDLNDKYALGWGAVDRPWAGGRALTHSGSNTMWFSTVWIAPAEKTVYIVSVNVGGGKAAKFADGAIGKLIEFNNLGKSP